MLNVDLIVLIQIVNWPNEMVTRNCIYHHHHHHHYHRHRCLSIGKWEKNDLLCRKWPTQIQFWLNIKYYLLFIYFSKFKWGSNRRGDLESQINNESVVFCIKSNSERKKRSNHDLSRNLRISWMLNGCW